MEKDGINIPSVLISSHLNTYTTNENQNPSGQSDSEKHPTSSLKPPKPTKKSRKRQVSDSAASDLFLSLKQISPFHKRTKRLHSMGSGCTKVPSVLTGNGNSSLKPLPFSPHKKSKVVPEISSTKSESNTSNLQEKIKLFESDENIKIEIENDKENEFDPASTLVCVSPNLSDDNDDYQIEISNRKVKKTPSSYPDIRNKKVLSNPDKRSQSFHGFRTYNAGSNIITDPPKGQKSCSSVKENGDPDFKKEFDVPRRFSQPYQESRCNKLNPTQVNSYKILDEIGRGSFGAVRKCYSLRDNTYYALKIVSKSFLIKKYRMSARRPGRLTKGDPLETLYREIAILKKMDHEYIVKLIEVIDDPQVDNVFMVFELVNNGEVMQIPTENPLSEDRARRYFRQLVLGMEYVHYSKIVHRDIKPSNLLLDDKDQIKIADFGVSIMFENDSDLTNKSAGSPAFQAPEVLNYSSKDKYSGTLVDIWAMGVTLFCFVYGRCPFIHSNIMELCEMIKEKPVEFPDSPEVNPQCIDLISQMLAKNPNERITIEEIKVHPWVTEGGKCVLPATEKHCQMIQVTNEEISNSIKVIRKIASIVFIKKMFEAKSFGINKRKKSTPNPSENEVAIS